MVCPPDLAAILLAGGFGTRIQHLAPDLPKPMIPFNGRPFVEWVVGYLAKQGVEDFVLSTGYLAEKVEAHFRTQPVPGAHVTCRVETEPLGTGGAILFNLPAVRETAEWILVGNGDSIVEFSLEGMLAQAVGDTEGVILGIQMPDCTRYGKLAVDASGRLTGFAEKSPGPGLINAGIYLLSKKSLLGHALPPPMSIERDYFPSRLAAGAIYKVVSTGGAFLDIGTPESFAIAEEWVRKQEWLNF
jgi:D-glycero-alpha-D-manno-heptose 1-phosphate guanylyltransferase